MSVAGEGLVEAVQALTGGRMAHSAIECVGGELFAQVRLLGGWGLGRSVHGRLAALQFPK